jgi:quinol monooxygenase YgiN
LIQRIVTYRVEAHAVDVVLAAIDEFVAGIRAHEPDTVAYHAYRYLDDATEFVHTMTFADEAGRDLHTKTAHVAHFVEVLYPLCVEPPVLRDITMVASSADPSVG